MHFHKYSTWQNLKQDYIEGVRGQIFYYVIQKRICEKCGRVKIRMEEKHLPIK